MMLASKCAVNKGFQQIRDRSTPRQGGTAGISAWVPTGYRTPWTRCGSNRCRKAISGSAAAMTMKQAGIWRESLTPTASSWRTDYTQARKFVRCEAKSKFWGKQANRLSKPLSYYLDWQTRDIRDCMDDRCLCHLCQYRHRGQNSFHFCKKDIKVFGTSERADGLVARLSNLQTCSVRKINCSMAIKRTFSSLDFPFWVHELMVKIPFTE